MTTITTPTSVFASTRQEMWAHYHATIEFTERLTAGNPSDPKLVEGWLAKNLGVTDEEQLKQWTMQHMAELHGISDPSEITDDLLESAMEAAAQNKAQVFKRDENGRPYIEARQVKAMLREATNIAFPFPEKWCREQKPGGRGLTAGKTPIDTVRERVHVPSGTIILGDDIDGVDLHVGHLKDFRGNTRSTIGYCEYTENSELEFDVYALDDYIQPEQWARIWTVAELNGLGARRSQGSGQFVVTGWERMS